MIQKNLIPLWTVGLMLMACCLHAADPGNAGTVLTLKEKIRAMYDRIPVDHTVYGRVVDQKGDGIVGADVELTWHSASWLLGEPDAGKIIWLKTDGKGFWHAVLKKPLRAFTYKVVKDGYAYIGNEGRKSRDLIDPPTSKDNPVVAVLRKKESPTFMIMSPGLGGYDRVFLSDGTNRIGKSLDVLAWRSGPGWKGCSTPSADLRMDAVFDVTGKMWNITYSVTNGAEGFVFSDQLLYMAPESGYVRQASMAVTNYGQRVYLYLKSRKPAIYSRVCFEHLANVGKENPLQLLCSVWINPYGDRSLEYDERAHSVYGLVADDLEKEAKAALHSGRLPPRPDMEARVKQRQEQFTREQEREAQWKNSPKAKRLKEENDRMVREFMEQQNKKKEGKVP